MSYVSRLFIETNTGPFLVKNFQTVTETFFETKIFETETEIFFETKSVTFFETYAMLAWRMISLLRRYFMQLYDFL